MKKIIASFTLVMLVAFSVSADNGGGKKKKSRKNKEVATASCCASKDSLTEKEGASCSGMAEVKGEKTTCSSMPETKAEGVTKNEAKAEGKSCCSKEKKS